MMMFAGVHTNILIFIVLVLGVNRASQLFFSSVKCVCAGFDTWIHDTVPLSYYKAMARIDLACSS